MIVQKCLRLLGILAIAAQLNCAPALAADGEGSGAESGWSTNFSESLDRAEKEHKLGLADFYTSWCGWCKRLDQTTFADPAFNQYLSEHYIAVKLNAEDHGEGQRTAQKNDVSAYPTGLVFTPQGKVVGRIFGYFDASQYKAKLVKFAKKAPKH
jgi:thiol:disulfide interchange protein